MVDTTKKEVKPRDVFYYRRRLKNRIFARLASYFAEEAERTGITKKDLADRLNKDPSQITRWLSGPSNLTLDTLSDLLLAMDAEADPPRFVRFSDRPKANYLHPLIPVKLKSQPIGDVKLPTAASAHIVLNESKKSISVPSSTGEVALDVS
jgi:transcriptional regulator with XRE-family HTH domain